MKILTKRAVCRRCPSNTEFFRSAEVQGPTTEIVDENLRTVEWLDCGTFTLIRRFTGVYCGKCRRPVTITMI